jgi:hypothetical protein
MAPAEVSVAFPFNIDEWARATRLMLAQSASRWWIRIGGSGAALLATWGFVRSLQEGLGLSGAIINALPWSLLAWFWLHGLTTMVLWQQKRIITKKLPSVTGAQIRTFSPTGFYYATPQLAQHFAWSAVQRVVETDEFLIIFVAPGAGHYLPKYAIPVADEPRLREILAAAFAERPKLLQLQGSAA